MCRLNSVMSRPPDQLLSLDEFSLLHDKYPNTISATYFVVRDQYAKNEVHKMGLKDGLPLGLDCYCIMGRSKASDIKRILIPWPVDKELDLLWLSRCLNWCKDEDILDVFLCFYSGESIIMASRSVMPVGGTKVKRVMTQAINLIFEFMKNKERVQIWLYENVAMKLEGIIIGFDEYMNVVLDTAEEVYIKSGNRKTIGRILLKGDCITLIQRVDPKSGASL